MADNQSAKTSSSILRSGGPSGSSGGEEIDEAETNDLKSAASVFLNLLKKSEALNSSISSLKEISDIAKLFEEHKIMVQGKEIGSETCPEANDVDLPLSSNNLSHIDSKKAEHAPHIKSEVSSEKAILPESPVSSVTTPQQPTAIVSNCPGIIGSNSDSQQQSMGKPTVTDASGLKLVDKPKEGQSSVSVTHGKEEHAHLRSLLKKVPVGKEKSEESPLPQTIVVKVDPSSKSINSINYSVIGKTVIAGTQPRKAGREKKRKMTVEKDTSKTKRSQKKCRICGLVFSKKAILRVHMANVHKISVDFAPATMPDEEIKEGQLEGKKRKTKKGKAGKRLASKKIKKDSTKDHEEEETQIDEDISNSSVFNESNNMDFKMKAPMYHCFYCDKEFYSKTNVLRHIWNHEKAKKYQCNFCDWTYNRAHELHGHLEKFHANEKLTLSPENKDELTCGLCGETFINRYVLKNHMAIHRGEKRNQCKICGKRFSRYSDTKRHVRQMHDKENKIEDLNLYVEKIEVEDLSSFTNDVVPSTTETENCDDASNKYSSEQKSVGSRLSSGENSFSCKKCHKSFTEESSLKRHSLIHLLPQEKCEFCGRMYFHLEKHIWEVHENEISTNTQGQEMEVEKASKGTKKAAKKSSYKHNKVQEPYPAESSIVGDFLCAFCGKQAPEVGSESGACFGCQPKQLGDLKSAYPYVCSVCGFKYKEMSRWQQHVQSHSDSKPFTCEDCQKAFKTKRAFERHQLDHKESKDVYCCDVCGLIFSCPYKVTKHRKNVHQKESVKKKLQYICFICLLKTRSREQLWNHLDIHYGSEDIVCQFCDRVFQGGHELAKHGRSIHGSTTRPYSCQYCDIRFPLKSELEDHIRQRHLEHPEHLCDQCDAKFLMYFDLKLHVLAQHEKRLKRSQSVRDLALKGKYDGPFPCTICARIFQRKFSLNSHMKVHLGIYDYPCDFCDKKFKTKAEWNIHRRHHTKEKPYVCPFCDAKFSRQSSWLRHKRGHQGFFPYMCEKCGKRFTSPKGLRKHIQVHDREDQKEGGEAGQVLRRGGPVLMARNDTSTPVTSIKDELILITKTGAGRQVAGDIPTVLATNVTPEMLITVAKNEPNHEERDTTLHTQVSGAVGLQDSLMRLQDASAMTYIMEPIPVSAHDPAMASTYVMPRNTIVIDAADTDLLFGNNTVYRGQNFSNL